MSVCEYYNLFDDGDTDGAWDTKERATDGHSHNTSYVGTVAVVLGHVTAWYPAPRYARPLGDDPTDSQIGVKMPGVQITMPWPGDGSQVKITIGSAWVVVPTQSLVQVLQTFALCAGQASEDKGGAS